MDVSEQLKEVFQPYRDAVSKLVWNLTKEEYESLELRVFPPAVYFSLSSFAMGYASTNWEYNVWHIGEEIFKVKLESELEP